MDRKGVLLGYTGSTRAGAYDFYETVTANIEFFLERHRNSMHFQIEEAAKLFPLFCDKINALVDLKAALAEFDKRHNSSRRPDDALAEV
jgi:hypothetical protein